jgi:isocitrate lyase
VLVPAQTFIRTLNAARLAADICGVPTLLLARADAHSAALITSDTDERDHRFIDRDQRTPCSHFERIAKSQRGSSACEGQIPPD